jgi:2-keto-3-deoxy-L-rhamnonate aldolase RhmA
MSNPLCEALRKRRLSLGAWIQVGHPAVAEILAGAGFDWVCVDLEHGAIGIETLAELFRAMAPSRCVPVVRVPANDPVWIRRSLDAGARGVIVPMVNSAAEAAAAVRAARYPPRGNRGYGYCRANAYGARFDAYARTANSEVAVIVQVEHKDAVADIDAILTVEGVDGTFVGPYDLSGSLGVPGNLGHPTVRRALARYCQACRAHRKAAGVHVVRPDAAGIAKAVREGYTLIALGLDTVFLQDGAAQALRQARCTEHRQRSTLDAQRSTSNGERGVASVSAGKRAATPFSVER